MSNRVSFFDTETSSQIQTRVAVESRSPTTNVPVLTRSDKKSFIYQYQGQGSRKLTYDKGKVSVSQKLRNFKKWRKGFGEKSNFFE